MDRRTFLIRSAKLATGGLALSLLPGLAQAVEMADKAVQAAIEAAKIDETIAAEMEKIQPEINRTIEEAMKAIDINEKAAKEASKVKSSFSGIVYIDGVESSKERMDNLNPDRIASMNVYKGNEAIAKFGEKGRNGVIEIKLKK